MYLHIGNGRSVRKRDVIGIFDLDTATVSKNTKVFIDRASKSKRVFYDDTDLPRSFILVTDEEGESVILSRISTVGLSQRAEAKAVEFND